MSRVEVYFDGACPLCAREIALLRRLDRSAAITFTDITAASFDPSSIGVTRERLMARIHGRASSGALVEGVEVFRQLYEAVGLGPAVALTRLPGVSHGLDLAYAWFARNRLRITGRCDHESCEVRPGPTGTLGESREEEVWT